MTDELKEIKSLHAMLKDESISGSCSRCAFVTKADFLFVEIEKLKADLTASQGA